MQATKRNTMFSRWKCEEIIPLKCWPWFYPVFSVTTTPFPQAAPSHLDSWMPALIASGESTTKSWFWVYSVKQRRLTMEGREQSSGLEGQITKDRWKQRPLSGSHPGTGLWCCGAEGSAPSALWSSDTIQGRPREERDASLVDAASTTSRMRRVLEAGWEERSRIQMKFGSENLK